MTRNRILMTCAIASLALGLSACSSDDDAAPLAMMAPEVIVLTPAEMLEAAQSRLAAAQEAVDNLAADATPEEEVAAYGELAVAQLAQTAAKNLPENQPPPTAAEMLVDARLRLAAAQEAVENLAADATATPEQAGAAATELRAAELALTVAENLPENQPQPPTELQVAQAAAADAATAAMIAAGTANTSADDADEARVNVATMQTGETSSGHAYQARHYAEIAQTAYMAAKTASEDAAAATTVSAAVRAQVAAEAAMAEAVAAEADADTHAGLAMTAAGGELKIVGTVKSVGDTSIDADVGATVKTDVVGTTTQTTKTGEIDKVRTSGPAVGGVAFVAAAPDMADTTDVNEAVAEIPHRQAVAAVEMLTIGKMVDSADDIARLIIVDSYVGTKSVKVYADSTEGNVEVTVGSDGMVVIGGETYTLTSEGIYYLAGAADEANDLAHNDVVDPTLDPKEVFSYPGGTAGAAIYVVLTPITARDGNEVVISTYQRVDIDVTGPMVDGGPTVMQVMASIPDPTAYKHIHFGVWAALKEAAANGDQDLADLGIGFVQNFSGSDLTGDDMPYSGMAKYRGDWVAAVQEKDGDGNGDIALKNGTASLSAYFETDKITANLDNLAKLEGTIAGNKFSGDKASDISAMHGLDAEADFEGTFNGGFYGTNGAEAAGIFDFAATDDGGDNVGGAFRGAFGADKK